jgi:alkanesulfonate monooxygenase SsuD/methylene tetrahydromethanopterin reductase-like flavin-dependent oxidoreductase (luciferase family)
MLRPGQPGLFDAVLAQASAAEEAGFDSVWVPDHLMQAPAVAAVEDPMLECYTTLGALAAATSTVRLGAFVGCPTYRGAALLGKILTTLDVISHGRAIFGIGAGWYEAEHRAYGFEMVHQGERYERLIETVEIVRSMFANRSTTYHGRHHRGRRRVELSTAPATGRAAGHDRWQRREEDPATRG